MRVDVLQVTEKVSKGREWQLPLLISLSSHGRTFSSAVITFACSAPLHYSPHAASRLVSKTSDPRVATVYIGEYVVLVGPSKH